MTQTALMISASRIADDPRVRRAGDSLHGLGWKVAAVGLAGARGVRPDWEIVEVGGPAPDESGIDGAASPPNARRYPAYVRWLWYAALSPLLAGLLLSEGALALGRPNAARRSRARRRALIEDRGLPVRLLRKARLLFWMWRKLSGRSVDPALASQILRRADPGFAALERASIQVAGQIQPDLVIANDWRVLPIAAQVKADHGAGVLYDSHEFAVEEYADRRLWRLTMRPLVAAVEAGCIPAADAVITVSSGIARALEQRYALPNPVAIVRNAPRYREIAFRPVGKEIALLYHGAVSPGRGLEACIRSARHWAQGRTLTIRGPEGRPGFAAELAEIARDHGVEDRIRFEPPVGMGELVVRAAAFDVGIMALPGSSAHNRFALPNKLFEYMMAGLALAVSDLPEMRELVRRRGVGVMFPSLSAIDIAEVINGLTSDRINNYKRASLQAAKSLCWETESRVFLDLARASARRGDV